MCIRDRFSFIHQYGACLPSLNKKHLESSLSWSIFDAREILRNLIGCLKEIGHYIEHWHFYGKSKPRTGVLYLIKISYQTEIWQIENRCFFSSVIISFYDDKIFQMQCFAIYGNPKTKTLWLTNADTLKIKSCIDLLLLMKYK